MLNHTIEIEPGIHEVSDAEGRAWKEGLFQNGACDDRGVAWVSMLIPLAEPR